MAIPPCADALILTVTDINKSRIWKVGGVGWMPVLAAQSLQEFEAEFQEVLPKIQRSAHPRTSDCLFSTLGVIALSYPAFHVTKRAQKTLRNTAAKRSESSKCC